MLLLQKGATAFHSPGRRECVAAMALVSTFFWCVVHFSKDQREGYYRAHLG